MEAAKSFTARYAYAFRERDESRRAKLYIHSFTGAVGDLFLCGQVSKTFLPHSGHMCGLGLPDIYRI